MDFCELLILSLRLVRSSCCRLGNSPRGIFKCYYYYNWCCWIVHMSSAAVNRGRDFWRFGQIWFSLYTFCNSWWLAGVVKYLFVASSFWNLSYMICSKRSPFLRMIPSFMCFLEISLILAHTRERLDLTTCFDLNLLGMVFVDFWDKCRGVAIHCLDKVGACVWFDLFNHA